MPKMIDTDVLEILRGLECDGQNARMTCGQLDRKTYERTNKVLEALGGKWNRKAKAHVFDGDAAELLGDAVATGEYIDAKQEYQFFETPAAVADILLEDASFSTGDRILEPSAGRGALVRAALGRGADRLHIAAVELNEQHRKPLGEAGCAVTIGDFTRLPAGFYGQAFDAVVMNPPFTRSQDIQHVRHAYDFLAPGGRLWAVMSIGWTFRQDRKATDFKEWLNGRFHHWEPLPEGSFKESGTMVNAVAVRIDKAA